jgi:hypothetical protein
MATGAEHKLLVARSGALTIIRTMRRPGAGVPLRAAIVAEEDAPPLNSHVYRLASRSWQRRSSPAT